MAMVGLRDLYYAVLTTDDPTKATPETRIVYETPVRVVGAISANINPNTSSSTLFADDGPADTATTMGEISVELGVADLPQDVQAELLGHTFEDGLLIKSSNDVPPWVAIGFRSLKSNGKYRYFWLAKGKFALPEEDYNTKGDSVEFGTPTITGSFVKRDTDSEWERVGDEDDTNFTATMKEKWFTTPLVNSTVV